MAVRSVIFLMTTMVVKRGDIFYADLSPVIGSEQGGIRPVIIIQNDIGNKYSPTVIVSAITSQINKAKLPTHVEISSVEYGLNRDSVVLLEQIRTLDKKRLKEKIGHMTDIDMKRKYLILSTIIALILLTTVGLAMGNKQNSRYVNRKSRT